MSETNPTLPPRPARTASNAFNIPPGSSVRLRLGQHQPSHKISSQSPGPDLSRRRSSLLSFSSLEDATQSFHDDILNPSTSRSGNGRHEEEVSHWHSTPLAFAILPAIGGLMFQNGSAFITDILLLSLAAVFLNWSIRLPWDWYYSAQALRRDVEPDVGAISEELDVDETAVEAPASADSSPKQTAERESVAQQQGADPRQRAAADLRKQELLALCATFLFPLLAAYLLHLIRAQLSTTSTTLVSDYNLSIFILAAEVRPCRQIIRIIASRTLHLQRTASGPDHDTFHPSNRTISDLTTRLADLEAKLTDHALVPPTVTLAQKADLSDLSSEMRKRYDPRLEGLERAVRRYEKRSTTLAMLTEQRLQSLEGRLQDALSLAAVAVQHSQNSGMAAGLLEVVSTVVAWPVRVGWAVVVWPLRVVEEAYRRFKDGTLGPSPPKGGKRGSSGKVVGARDEKGRDGKAGLVTRKVVR